VYSQRIDKLLNTLTMAKAIVEGGESTEEELAMLCAKLGNELLFTGNELLFAGNTESSETDSEQEEDFVRARESTESEIEEDRVRARSAQHLRDAEGEDRQEPRRGRQRNGQSRTNPQSKARRQKRRQGEEEEDNPKEEKHELLFTGKRVQSLSNTVNSEIEQDRRTKTKIPIFIDAENAEVRNSRG
jgi:hypothetical protein